MEGLPLLIILIYKMTGHRSLLVLCVVGGDMPLKV